AELRRRLGDRFRRGAVRQRVPLARLADVPVLAELAGEVAAGGAEGEDRRAGKEVVKRLLFDRVHAEPARAAVRGEHDALAVARPHEAEPALPRMQLAVARADVALDAAVVEPMPVAGGNGVLQGGLGHRAPLDDTGAGAFNRLPPPAGARGNRDRRSP